MATLREESALTDARSYANAATFDIQQLPEDIVSRQALHNLLAAVDALITAVDSITSKDEQ